MTQEFYYRFEDKRCASGGWDIHGEWDPGPSYTEVQLRQFEVIKRTPKGAWIRSGLGDRTFICDTWRKAYAHRTIALAKASFIRRKERQAGIYEARARIAREAIHLINADLYRDPSGKKRPWTSSRLPITSMSTAAAGGN